MKALNIKLQYYVLDVFTNENYKGNPLSVICTHGDLSLATYKKISREFGYSETSFAYYSSEKKSLQVRSFTPPGIEVNGAGHNLLGVVCLALLKDWDIFKNQNDERYVTMKDKEIPLSVNYDKDNLPVVSMLQQPCTLLNSIPKNEIAKALTLQPEDIAVFDWQPTVAKTDVAHLMVPVKSIKALYKAILNKPLLKDLSVKYNFQGCYCFSLTEKGAPHIAECRFFNPLIGIDEDAATGSAAGPFAGFLHTKNYLQAGLDFTLLQGVKMGQPSVIRFQVTDTGILVSGSSVITMEGHVYL